MCGILIWVFALSVGLSWCQFGYLDAKTAASMGLVLVPLLSLAVGILLRLDLEEPSDDEAQIEADAREGDRPSHATVSAVEQSPDGPSGVSVSRRASNPVRNGTGRRAFYIATGAAIALVVLGAAASLALAVYVFVVGKVGP